MARTFQSVRLLQHDRPRERHGRSAQPDQVGHLRRTLQGTGHTEERRSEKAPQALAFFDDRSPPPGSLASDLAYADRRRLEIARAMATEPKLLLSTNPPPG